MENVIYEIESIRKVGDYFEIIDQTLLPKVEKYITITNYKDMIKAIKKLQIRGAPLLGLAAYAAAYLACIEFKDSLDFKNKMVSALKKVEHSRPTARNLYDAAKISRLLTDDNPTDTFEAIQRELLFQMKYAREVCEKIAKKGYKHIPKKITRFLTHCNTGSLATLGIGTALGVLKRISQIREIEVYVTETRPLLQGARLTAWELKKANIPCTLITDSMAAWTIKNKGIQAVITGADCIAGNGDTANKIGTLQLAIIARHFDIPFYVVAPRSTMDRRKEKGEDIIIEERDPSEVTLIPDMKVYNPAFDVVPYWLITSIITDKLVYSIPRFDK